MNRTHNKNTKYNKKIISIIVTLIVVMFFITIFMTFITSNIAKNKNSDKEISEISENKKIDQRPAKEHEDGDTAYNMKDEEYTVDKFAENFTGHEFTIYNNISGNNVKKESYKNLSEKVIAGVWIPYYTTNGTKEIAYDIYDKDAAYLDTLPCISVFGKDGSYRSYNVNNSLGEYSPQYLGKWKYENDKITLKVDGLEKTKSISITSDGLCIANNGVKVYLKKDDSDKTADILKQISNNENIVLEGTQNDEGFLIDHCNFKQYIVDDPDSVYYDATGLDGTWDVYAIKTNDKVYYINKKEDKEYLDSINAKVYTVLFNNGNITEFSSTKDAENSFYGSGEYKLSDDSISFSLETYDPEKMEMVKSDHSLFIENGCFVDKETIPECIIYFEKQYQNNILRKAKQ